MHSSRLRRAHVLAIVLALAGAVTVLVIEDPGGRTARASRHAQALSTPSASSTPAPARVKGRTTKLFSGRESGGRTYVGAHIPKLYFEDVFPAQAAAFTDPAIPATNYWALLIGINDYYGGTRDNIGSYQDARDLRKHLLHLGWRSDHIVLLSNRTATASMILQSIKWLAAKSDRSSVVVFNYSGHEEPRHYGGTRHIMLHAADNRMIPDTQVARELGRVDAARMWIQLAVCRAGGFNDPGLVKAGRVVTFSSPERELSYEDPRVHHSVFGWFMIMEPMVYGYADYNNNADVTVEEAFRYAKSRVTSRTSGMQHPFIIDRQEGSFSLRPPRPAPPPAPSSETGAGDGCVVVCSESALEPE